MKLVFFLFFCTITSISAAQAAIFGIDNRLQITPKSTNYKFGTSTAIGVLRSLHTPLPSGEEKIDLDAMSDLVCPSERFSNNPSLSYACTGFLISPTLLITAGHCATNGGIKENQPGGYCEVYDWLFDFHASHNPRYLSKNLYHCKKIIYAIKEEKSPFRDFAIIELDRAVEGREPLELANEINKKSLLSMIGYPLGGWMTLSHSAKFFDIDNQEIYLTNLDAFDGNSGSPVFNEQKKVVGILVGGTPTSIFYTDPHQECSRYNFCSENGEDCMVPEKNPSEIPNFQGIGSEVQNIQSVKKILRSLKLID